MKSNTNKTPFLNSKFRKLIHYGLILGILLLQIIIAVFFYKELVNKKHLNFIEKQLNGFQALESLTENSREELFNAQDFLQKFILTEDDQYLTSYFNSLTLLDGNLEKIESIREENPELKLNLNSNKKENSKNKTLKVLIDSVAQFSTSRPAKPSTKLATPKKYNYNFDFRKYDVETKTISDTIAKKGIFGRLKDAISGTEKVRKDSTVVIMKEAKDDRAMKLKAEVDSVFNLASNHYISEIKEIQVTVLGKQEQLQSSSNDFNKTFSKLLLYTNDLIGTYELGITNSKIELQKQYTEQTSKLNVIRKYLVLSIIVLMFLVSILILYFTRMAFVYERDLKDANNQIEENLNFKNRILGMLSHELRAPLKIIGIFIKKITAKTKDETIKDYLKSISFTNDTLLMQANQILEYTKNQQVENKLIPVAFTLKEEIDSILTAIAPYIETRNNQFIITENINPTLQVFSDRTKINQIFMNILGNANKFTENGQIKVTINTEPIDEQTISLVTTVIDTGSGISPDDLEKIFEPYYQGVLSEKIENLGAGLGLSLCKEVIELYDGEISVSSELMKGTTVAFRLYLNLVK